MLQANVALIGLIEYVSCMDKKQAGRHFCILNDIKIMTARHLEIKRYINIVIKTPQRIYMAYVLNGTLIGLMAILTYFAVSKIHLRISFV